MKAIVREMPLAWLEERRRLGHDRFDEMWEGVLHVNPIPSNPHQDLCDDLLEALRAIAVSRHDRGRWRSERNLAKRGGWPADYRIPDLVYVGPDSAASDEGSRYEGAPEIVVEVAGEGDESRDKLGWYAELGVREVWILDVATRRPEVLLLSGASYLKQKPGQGGWFASELFPVELREAGARLELRGAGEAEPRARI